MHFAFRAFIVAFAISRVAASGSGGSCSGPHLNCKAESFRRLPSGATLESVTLVNANSSYGEGPRNVAYPSNPTDLPELCAVIIRVSSSATSSFRFGLFLPTGWNMRFLALGNGGFAGGINWLEMGAGVRYGFATMSTDTGHNSTSLETSWALRNPEARSDFGWRAMHGSVTLAKQIVKTFYGKKPIYSYYSGCSTGGRQGLKEVQISPTSFDGILVGAPVWWTSHSQLWGTKVGIWNLPIDSPGRIPVTMLPTMADEVVRQCDLVDDVADGIVNLPDQCDFNLLALACNGTNGPNCLNSEQIQTAKNIYGDYIADGRFAFPGLTLGSEKQWPLIIGGEEPGALGIGYVRDFLYDDPDLPWQAYNDSMVWYADAIDPGNCSATEYDMSAFRNHGGKIIMYHGQADALIATRSSNYFYEQVAGVMGGVDKLRNWFRLFLVPAMAHCATSAYDAPWYIAGSGQANAVGTAIYSVPGFEDAKHDALLALIEWVERGVEVNEIIATGWTQQNDSSTSVKRQRPLCPFPEVAVWDGQRDPDRFDSWSCQTTCS